MLLGRGHTVLGAASMHWAIVFSLPLWSAIAVRHRIAMDTRFIPGSEAARRDAVCLYLLIAGNFTIHDGASFEGPCAFLLTEAQLEGADGRRELTFRSEGRPLMAIELHLRAADLRVRPGAAPVPITLSEQTIDAARRAADLARHDDASLTAAMHALLARLVDDDLLERSAAEGASRPIPSAFARLWQGVRPMVERLYLSPTVQEVSAVSGVSERQVDRYVKQFVSVFGLMGVGWRPVTRHLRLKLSVMLLSAEGASIAEVARIVGYGSPDAMARAFRDASLAPPSEVQQRLAEAKS